MGDTQPSVLLVTVEVAEDDVDELNRWYDEEHGPEKMSLPGYVGMRRFRRSDGSPRFLAIYELTDPEAALGSQEMTPDSRQRLQALMTKWKQWDRSVWVEL